MCTCIHVHVSIFNYYIFQNKYISLLTNCGFFLNRPIKYLNFRSQWSNCLLKLKATLLSIE